MTDIKVALAQFLPANGNYEAFIAKTTKGIKNAAEQGVNLMVFPELYYPGYSCNKETHHKLAEEKNGQLFETVSKLAQEYKMHIVMGYAEKRPEEPGLLYNSLMFIDDEGKKIGDFSKVFGWGPENDIFEMGNKFPVIDTKFGKIGLAICYDIEFPETYRILEKKGAEIVVCSTAWSAYLRDRLHIALLAGATQNMLTVIGCNCVGLNPANRPMAGDSKIVSPMGRVLANASWQTETVGEAVEELLIYQIDSAEIIKERESYPIVSDLKPDMFDISLLEKY